MLLLSRLGFLIAVFLPDVAWLPFAAAVYWKSAASEKTIANRQSAPLSLLVPSLFLVNTKILNLDRKISPIILASCDHLSSRWRPTVRSLPARPPAPSPYLRSTKLAASPSSLGVTSVRRAANTIKRHAAKDQHRRLFWTFRTSHHHRRLLAGRHHHFVGFWIVASNHRGSSLFIFSVYFLLGLFYAG
ncbi:hypothetical protein BHM03_00043351 [Ensete ventricosum]|nr:hypothetical protein BHM03_00043351 [Ensete ventricosum]